MDGFQWLVLGMIVALIATRFCELFVRVDNKMPEGVPPTVVKSFEY